MHCETVEVLNKTGLHARPASMFVKKATEYQSDIHIRFSDRRINAKSIVGVLAAGINCGSTIEIVAEGPDEAEAVRSLADLVGTRFGE